jgi:uncharacterized protein YbaR (Trm112 family)
MRKKELDIIKCPSTKTPGVRSMTRMETNQRGRFKSKGAEIVS